MYTSMKKISKDKDVEPTEFEQSDAQALFDLETTHQELESDLKDLDINSASQIDVSSPPCPIAMSDDEIKQRLKGVRVYGLANAKRRVLQSRDEDSGISHLDFYFDEKDAKKSLKKAKLNNPGMYFDYEVFPFALSRVLKLMDDDDKSYIRFIPEFKQMQNAKRKICWRWKVSAKTREKISWPDDSSLPDVPVFKPKDLLVRVNDTDTFYRPLYFRLEDLNKSLAVSSGKTYTPVLQLGDFEVADLMAVIRGMKDDSNADWNNVKFIPPGKDVPADSSSNSGSSLA